MMIDKTGIKAKLPAGCRGKESVISVFKEGEFKQIKGVVHDVIVRCQAGSAKDMKDLESWKDHFKKIGEPFVETKKDVKATVKIKAHQEHSLWIEQVVAPQKRYGSG